MSLLVTKLDPREEHFRIPSHGEGPKLFLRYLPPNAHPTEAPKIVLYVHGGSFPSALSIAHRFDGRSWRDELTDAGFHVWGLDFQGFGGSDPYPEMAELAESNPVLGRAEAASRQIETFNGVCGAESGWVPVSASAPSLLLEKLEIEKGFIPPDRPPILGAPSIRQEKP